MEIWVVQVWITSIQFSQSQRRNIFMDLCWPEAFLSLLVSTLRMWIKGPQAYRSPQAGLAAELKPVFNWLTALNSEIWSAVFTLHLKVTFTYTLLFWICFFLLLHLSPHVLWLAHLTPYLVHPLWLCSLVCHSGLDIQISLVHRAQLSSSRCLSAYSPFLPPSAG